MQIALIKNYGDNKSNLDDYILNYFILSVHKAEYD